MQPLLSIVIVNYNYGRFLDEALRSVEDQMADPAVAGKVEMVVVDGASTDDSPSIVRRHAEAAGSPIGWWCSEPDKGQSDAFNKGFAHARGRYLTWLNADDRMVPGCLRRILRELERHPGCEWFTGNFYRFAPDGRVTECPWGPNTLPPWLQTKGQPLAVYGPSTIFTKGLLDRVGGIKPYQNFMMDTDLWMRFIVAGVKQRRIPCFCWAFRMHEESKTAEFGAHRLSPEQRARFEAERKRAYRETGYRPSRLNRHLILLWRLLDGSALKAWWLRRTFTRVPAARP